MSDGIKRIDSSRTSYNKPQSDLSGSPVLNELKQITAELKELNQTSDVNNATNSPYLHDQIFHKKEVIYNSPEESDWRKVRSYEESKQQALVFKNLRRLHII